MSNFSPPLIGYPKQASQSVAAQPFVMQKIDHCPAGTGGLFNPSRATRWPFIADDRFAADADDDLADVQDFHRLADDRIRRLVADDRLHARAEDVAAALPECRRQFCRRAKQTTD